MVPMRGRIFEGAPPHKPQSPGAADMPGPGLPAFPEASRLATRWGRTGRAPCRLSHRPLCNLPIDQFEHSRGAAGDDDIVRGDEQGDLTLDAQGTEQLDDLLASMGIEVAGWFVGQQ